MKGKTALRTPVTFNKQIGKSTTSEHAFSDQKWGEQTRGCSRAADRRSTAQLASVLEKARLIARQIERNNGNDSDAGTEETEDEWAQVCK